MRYLAAVLVSMLLGCATFKADPPIAYAKEYGMTNRAVSITVEDNSWRMYCSGPDVANDINCVVGVGYLQQNLIDWRFINASEARQMCAEGMRAIAYVDNYDIQACAFALLRIRFMQLPPEEKDENR